MAEKKKDKDIEVHVAQVVRHKGPILLPEEMTTEDAVAVLQRKLTYDAEKVRVDETIPAFVWDGALALQKALVEMFGLAQQTVTPSWFGDIPPAMISIETSPTETVKVPWGRFSLPGITGWVASAVAKDESGRALFRVVAEVTHADEDRVRKLIARTRVLAKAESIYRGKAFSLRFNDDGGDPLEMPTPKFLGLTAAPVVFNRDLEQAIETNLLTPIRYSDAVRKAGIPLKRGTLLAGVYGTGKTLTANLVAGEAVKHGWTFIYVTKVEELGQVLQFAQDFQPAVVFAEDVDRAAGRERTDEVNDLLNILDGIGSKAGEIITILTSNHPENINPAMRRPGRVDVVLAVEPPDAEAASRLMRLYGGASISPTEDLLPAGAMLNGEIPAVIREVVERAKLEAIRRAGGETSSISGADLLAAAKVLKAERTLFAPAAPGETAMEQLARGLGMQLAEGMRPEVKRAIEKEMEHHIDNHH